MSEKETELIGICKKYSDCLLTTITWIAKDLDNLESHFNMDKHVIYCSVLAIAKDVRYALATASVVNSHIVSLEAAIANKEQINVSVK